jgi:hypothetical protein
MMNFGQDLGRSCVALPNQSAPSLRMAVVEPSGFRPPVARWVALGALQPVGAIPYPAAPASDDNANLNLLEDRRS